MFNIKIYLRSGEFLLSVLFNPYTTDYFDASHSPAAGSVGAAEQPSAKYWIWLHQQYT